MLHLEGSRPVGVASPVGGPCPDVGAASTETIPLCLVLLLSGLASAGHPSGCQVVSLSFSKLVSVRALATQSRSAAAPALSAFLELQLRSLARALHVVSDGFPWEEDEPSLCLQVLATSSC